MEIQIYLNKWFLINKNKNKNISSKIISSDSKYLQLRRRSFGKTRSSLLLIFRFENGKSFRINYTTFFVRLQCCNRKEISAWSYHCDVVIKWVLNWEHVCIDSTVFLIICNFDMDFKNTTIAWTTYTCSIF